jgi:hypothetical protein
MYTAKQYNWHRSKGQSQEVNSKRGHENSNLQRFYHCCYQVIFQAMLFKLICCNNSLNNLVVLLSTLQFQKYCRSLMTLSLSFLCYHPTIFLNRKFPKRKAVSLLAIIHSEIRCLLLLYCLYPISPYSTLLNRSSSPPRSAVLSPSSPTQYVPCYNMQAT